MLKSKQSVCSKMSAALTGVAIAVSLITIVSATALIIHNTSEKKRIGGRLIKVNYNFSKEFDN